MTEVHHLTEFFPVLPLFCILMHCDYQGQGEIRRLVQMVKSTPSENRRPVEPIRNGREFRREDRRKFRQNKRLWIL